MKARINNHVVKVQVIDANYNDHATEVKVLDNEWHYAGMWAIVENTDLIAEKVVKTKRFLVQRQDFNYKTKLWSYRSFGYCETLEEARKLVGKAGYSGSPRILDRWTGEYTH